MGQSTRPFGPPGAGANDRLLQRIAAALGVPVDALFVPPDQLLFHTGPDGTQWLLGNAAPGSPTGCCVCVHAPERIPAEEDVATFLVQNLDSPQGQALAALIDRVLTMHLGLGMRV
ncbi:hypothetical protein [Methylobacterium sp. J-076]|uniref:hypothetical protein n=1 Tax=Methylobacterium sp. J-076 TaxID=2836655 RepID=UPI001FB8C9F7|nr:hypothetical protein [Methylobacterium sp. J-076]MCJ2012203.1 hypothetical protein [Methylobacterium sp. J-076]